MLTGKNTTVTIKLLYLQTKVIRLMKTKQISRSHTSETLI
ncbi:hypothetical protein CCP3SC15_1260008 [Gammaproteobacteria bacterium]